MVRLWKWDGTPGPIGQRHKSGITCLAWSPDGETLASGAYWSDDTIRLWRPNDDHSLVLPNPELTKSLAWSPDGSSLASGGADGVIRIWNPNDDVKIAEYTKVQGYITGLAWSPDGKQLVSTHYEPDNRDSYIDIDFRTWDVASHKSIASGDIAGVWLNGLDWHPKSGLAVASQSGYVCLVDAVSASQIAQSPQTHPVGQVAWSPDGTRIADSRGRLFRIEDKKLKELQPPWPEIRVESIEEGGASGARVSWKDGRSATVWADGRIEGEEELVERGTGVRDRGVGWAVGVDEAVGVFGSGWKRRRR